MSASEGTDGLQRMAAEAREGADYQTEQVLDCVTEAIVDRMLRLGLTRRELAHRLGVSPGQVTRLLRGLNNFTVRTLVEVSRALDCELSVALVPRRADSPGVYHPSTTTSDPPRAAEARAAYAAGRRSPAYASRDDEIRAYLSSGKLRVEHGTVYMRHESDGQYRPAKFRAAGTHSTMEKTNVGPRAYYRDRIIAVAAEIERR